MLQSKSVLKTFEYKHEFVRIIIFFSDFAVIFFHIKKMIVI